MQHSQPQSVVQQQQAQAQPAQVQQTVQQQPQVITLQQLQNFLPQQATSTPQIHQLNASDAAQLQQQVQAFQAQQAAASVAGSPQQNNSQAQQIKTLYASPSGQQQVINLPQQFIQVKNDAMPQQIIQIKQPDGSVTQQIIQMKPSEQQIQQQQQQQQQAAVQQVIQGGQLISGHNGIFQVVQPVTVDGQEALFIPNQLQNAQPIQQAFITPTGQIVRGPVMAAPGNFLHNMAQTVQLPNGK